MRGEGERTAQLWALDPSKPNTKRFLPFVFIPLHRFIFYRLAVKVVGGGGGGIRMNTYSMRQSVSVCIQTISGGLCQIYLLNPISITDNIYTHLHIIPAGCIPNESEESVCIYDN
jgi:hypothetical protein